MAKQKKRFTWVRFTADYAEWKADSTAELIDWYADMLIGRGVAVMHARILFTVPQL